VGVFNFIIMKNIKITLLFSLVLLASNFLRAQQGLEGLVIEKYYQANAADVANAAANGASPALTTNTIVYRVYVDMLPGYKFQAAYGVPGHEMRIATTTLFFNNEDRGAITPTYTKNQAKDNTVMLDTWVSVGGACTGNVGVLKTADDGVATNVNNDGVLQNAHPAAGIPLTEQDGLLAGTFISPTILGAEDQFAMFDAQNDGTNGPVFSTSDASWASLGGSLGPNPETNQVLIAQITTDGVLSFELNIQIGTPEGGVERYVAANPIDNEILFPGLTYVSDVITKAHYQQVNNQIVSLFPNPAMDEVSFQLNDAKDGLLRYSIFNMRGELVSVKTNANYSANSIETIDISSLAKGQYILEIISNGKRSTNKFVKN
jgi:hypothetical protein